MGLKSINKKFVDTDNYKIMQSVLHNEVTILTLKQLNCHSDHDGFNHHNQVEDTICNFEIFLAGASNGFYQGIM